MWDIKTGKTLLVYKEHSDNVTCVGIAPDGNTAITGSDDKTARYSLLMSDGVFSRAYISPYEHSLGPSRWAIRVIVLAFF